MRFLFQNEVNESNLTGCEVSWFRKMKTKEMTEKLNALLANLKEFGEDNEVFCHFGMEGETKSLTVNWEPQKVIKTHLLWVQLSNADEHLCWWKNKKGFQEFQKHFGGVVCREERDRGNRKK